MRKIIKSFLWLLLLAGVLVSMDYTLTYNHEKIHQAIGNQYGVNSTIEIKQLGLGGGKTYYDSEQYSRLSYEDKDAMRKYNIITEEIDYRLIPFMLMLIAFAMVLLIIKVEDKK
jgi:hypothetical protein